MWLRYEKKNPNLLSHFYWPLYLAKKTTVVSNREQSCQDWHLKIKKKPLWLDIGPITI